MFLQMKFGIMKFRVLLSLRIETILPSEGVPNIILDYTGDFLPLHKYRITEMYKVVIQGTSPELCNEFTGATFILHPHVVLKLQKEKDKVYFCKRKDDIQFYAILSGCLGLLASLSLWPDQTFQRKPRVI